MTLARVIGDVTSSVKHPILEGEKLLLLRAVSPQGAIGGASLLALDRAQAGPGDTVLVLDEGNSARQILGVPRAPMRTVVVGIVDEVDETPGPTESGRQVDDRRQGEANGR
ncbi:MAG: EutN/CcmL family microcompartment protein [Spirochaetaceae bacterium]